MGYRRNVLWTIVLTLIVSGCAGSTGTSKAVGPSALAPVPSGGALAIRVDAKPEVVLTSVDKERLTQLIAKHVQTDLPGRFRTINQPSTGSLIEAIVTIKTYEEGSAFARAMLAGLGQMHIDADVTMRDARTGQSFGTYEVTKTFAWGGLYGGVTRITDIEDGFAQAVVEAIGGQSK
jgi:hypothetical protein